MFVWQQILLKQTLSFANLYPWPCVSRPKVLNTLLACTPCSDIPILPNSISMPVSMWAMC